MAERKEHPVIAGFAALIGVGLAVGLLLGLITMAATDVLGIDGEAATVQPSGQEESLFVPKPSRTEGPDGPLITLAPGEGASAPESESPQGQKSGKKRQISLQAGQQSVGSMDRIDLTGTYKRGQGSILQVQRRQGEGWEDFPVTVSVANGTFSTYVQTGRSGKNKFRVRDSDTNTTSNPVTVTVN